MCIGALQHGQSAFGGATVSWMRGRCVGKAPRLRVGVRGSRGSFFSSTASFFASDASMSSSASRSWSEGSRSSRSFLAPKR
jgi:hypothetical protein